MIGHDERTAIYKQHIQETENRKFEDSRCVMCNIELETYISGTLEFLI